MTRIAVGSLLQADVEALVNTVNCDGFMGKGIALQFKQAWPENFDAYAKAWRAKEVRPGRCLSGKQVEWNFSPQCIGSAPIASPRRILLI